jgi:hypothetical protein
MGPFHATHDDVSCLVVVSRLVFGHRVLASSLTVRPLPCRRLIAHIPACVSFLKRWRPIKLHHACPHRNCAKQPDLAFFPGDYFCIDAMSSHIFRIYIPRSLSSFSFWIHRPHHTRKTSLKSASTGTSRSYSCIGSLRAHTMMFLKNMRRPSLFLVLLYAVRADATASVSATLPTNQHADPVDNVDWASFNFGLNGVETEQMWMDRAPVDSYGRASYSTDCLQPTGTLNLSPAATVLNYGQALFEGLKAFRRADGTIAMFRPEKNAARMQQVRTILVLDTYKSACTRSNGALIPSFLEH